MKALPIDYAQCCSDRLNPPPKAATQRETLRSFPQHLQPDRENATWRKCVEKRLGSADCALETGRLAWESARKRLNRWLILRRREKRRQSSGLYGGERGIRTPGAPKGTTDFESAPFDHSGISPRSERTANFIRRARSSPARSCTRARRQAREQSRRRSGSSRESRPGCARRRGPSRSGYAPARACLSRC